MLPFYLLPLQSYLTLLIKYVNEGRKTPALEKRICLMLMESAKVSTKVNKNETTHYSVFKDK